MVKGGATSKADAKARTLARRARDLVLKAEAATPLQLSNLPDDGGFVYIIGETGGDASTAVKIGLARSEAGVGKRLHSMSTGNPRELQCLWSEKYQHARWVEHQLHSVLTPWNVVLKNAREWFRVRDIAGSNWGDFVASALSGTVPGAAPPPSPSPIDGHELLYVHGVPRHLWPVCSCGWIGPEGSVYVALATTKVHFERPLEQAGDSSYSRMPSEVRITPDGDSDDAVVAALRSTPPKVWRAFDAAVSAWQQHGTPPEPPTLEQVGETDEGNAISNWPHYDYGDVITRVIDLLHAVGAVVEFDWGEAAMFEKYRGGVGLDAAPVPEAARLATTFIRGEHFGDGVIAEAIRVGAFDAVLNRLLAFARDDGLLQGST